jgi:hypothetical protein
MDVLAGAVQVQIHRAGWWGEIGGRSFPRREVLVAQLVLPLQGGRMLHFFGSLGDASSEVGASVDHEHQFVCMFDVDHRDVVQLVAYARVHHLSLAALDAHHTYLLADTDSLRARGYTNVLVTRADLFTPFQNKNAATVAGVPMQFLGLVPLEPEEWNIKVRGGVDALFDSFAAHRRDLLTLRSAPRV